MARGALTSASIGCLYLDSNRLTEVPTSALTKTPNLEELSLSQNPILRVGRKAFQPISQSLKRLYMDQMGMEKVGDSSSPRSSFIQMEYLIQSLIFPISSF